MAVQLAPDMEAYLDGILSHAHFVLSAAKFCDRHRPDGLSAESLEELADVQARMVSLLATFEDGPAYGAVDNTVLYALRGFEATAAELLRSRLS